MVCLWCVGNEIVDRTVEIGVKNSLNSQSDSFFACDLSACYFIHHPPRWIRNNFFATFFFIWYSTDVSIIFYQLCCCLCRSCLRADKNGKFKALYSRLSLTPPRHSISDLRHTCMDEIISFFSVAAVEIVAVDCVAYVYGGNFWHARCCRWTFWKFYEITALNY